MYDLFDLQLDATCIYCENQSCVKLLEIIFLSFGFTAAIGAHSTSQEVVEFSPLWFPRGKIFVSLISCDY